MRGNSPLSLETGAHQGTNFSGLNGPYLYQIVGTSGGNSHCVAGPCVKFDRNNSSKLAFMSGAAAGQLAHHNYNMSIIFNIGGGCRARI